MKKKLFKDFYQTEKYSHRLSLFNEELLHNTNHPQRANSDPSSVINANTNISFDQSENISNIDSQNPINQLTNGNYKENESNKIFNEENEINTINKNNDSNENNEITDLLSLNFFNSTFYGFKGRSPYASPNLNNIINTSSNMNMNNNIKNNKNNAKNIIKNDNNNNRKMNQMNKNKKIGEAALITQLKDKILEYRCSVCNFVTSENEELHKHLVLKKHFTFPKKMKKLKKAKMFHKFENKNNQSFIYSIAKSYNNKKNYDKKIICRHCSKKFDSIHALNCHLNAHKYRCDNCNKLFNNKEDLLKHNEMELLFNFKNLNANRKKEIKSPGKKVKLEIDDWEEISSNKKDRWENDEDFNKINDFEQSYAFIEDNDENFDFNKMVKINK
jgi:hypothetical protein